MLSWHVSYHIGCALGDHVWCTRQEVEQCENGEPFAQLHREKVVRDRDIRGADTAQRGAFGGHVVEVKSESAGIGHSRAQPKSGRWFFLF